MWSGTLKVTGRRRLIFHWQIAGLRRSCATDCSLLALPDRSPRSFESRLSVTQVGGGVTVVAFEDLAPGGMQFMPVFRYVTLSFQLVGSRNKRVKKQNSTGNYRCVLLTSEAIKGLCRLFGPSQSAIEFYLVESRQIVNQLLEFFFVFQV